MKPSRTARPDELERLNVEVAEALSDHRSEARNERRADPEEGQTRLDADRRADHERRRDDDRPAHDDEHVPAEDANIREPRHPRGIHVELVLDADDQVAHDPVDAGRHQNPEDEHRRPIVAFGHGHQDDEQQQAREGHDEVEDPLGRAAHSSAEVSADQAEHDADRQGNARADQPGDDTRVDGVQETGEDVAAALVGAERIPGGARFCVDCGELGFVRVVRGEERSEQAEHDDDEQEARGDDRLRVAQEHAEHGAACGGGRLVDDVDDELLGHWILAFGLSHPFAMSVTRLTVTTSSTPKTVTPRMTGMSPWSAALNE